LVAEWLKRNTGPPALRKNDPLAYVWERFRWKPNVGPQTQAYLSDADVVGYGGAGGGGKTFLLLGLAAGRHKHAALFRRSFTNARDIIKKSRQIFYGHNPGKGNRYNAADHVWTLRDGQIIEIHHLQHEEDKENHRGNERDLLGFDEATEFSESQVRFVAGWNRSPDPNQICQLALTFNPPMNLAGSWVVEWFLPWLAYLFPDQFTHPNPAKPGELRYFVIYEDEHGNDRREEVDESELKLYIVSGGNYEEVQAAELIERDGITYRPQRGALRGGKVRLAKSRTFFPAKLSDNPILEATGYDAQIDALPEPMRSLMKGKFIAKTSDSVWQVIPTEWVKLAQDRWRAGQRPPLPMTALGVDVARGKDDEEVDVVIKGDDTALAPRYGNWFDELKVLPGNLTPNGRKLAGLVLAEHRDSAAIIIDAIGVGSSPLDYLKETRLAVHALVASARAVTPAGQPILDRSKKLHFFNVRAAMWWKFREMLDPEHGDDIALPPDTELAVDLCAPRWELRASGLLVESKKDIRKRIKRSTNRADAVVMAASLEWLFAEITAALAVSNKGRGSVDPQNFLEGL
jgi:hypothetical protein